MDKIILCVDMDAFFASVEQRANPRLRGKAIAVIGSGSRTVITTSSYEARDFGVKTGMNVYEARKLCPHIIFVVGNNEKYTHTCRELEIIYRRITPDVEIYSIDEAFLDITGTNHLFGGPEAVGATIKRIVKERFGINCTVGIAPNILMAKLASDLAKPDGLRWIRPEEIGPLLEDLPVKELWGIGRQTDRKLAAMGVETCGELGRTPVSVLRRRFGIMGEVLKSMGMGACHRPIVVNEEDARSIGHGMTLPRDIYDREEIASYLLQLSEMVGKRARRYGYAGRTLALIIRYPDFETLTRQTTLSTPTNDTHVIYRGVFSILDKIRLKDKIRLLGVRLSNLSGESGQMSLFGEAEKRKNLFSAVDSINDRYGEFSLMWGSYLRTVEPPTVISPAWRPSGAKNIPVK